MSRSSFENSAAPEVSRETALSIADKIRALGGYTREELAAAIRYGMTPEDITSVRRFSRNFNGVAPPEIPPLIRKEKPPN